MRHLKLSFAIAFFSVAAASMPVHAQIKPLSVLAKKGGDLQTGAYACKGQYNQAGYTYKVIELNSESQYHWVSGGKHPGRMQYDRGTGKITFKDGKLGTGFEAHFGLRDDGKPIFILVDTDLAPKADAYDYCVRR